MFNFLNYIRSSHQVSVNELIDQLYNKRHSDSLSPISDKDLTSAEIKLSNMKDADMHQLSQVGWKQRPFTVRLDFSESGRLTPAGIRALMSSFKTTYLTTEEMSLDNRISNLEIAKGHFSITKDENLADPRAIATKAFDLASTMLASAALKGEFPSPRNQILLNTNEGDDLSNIYTSSAFFVLGVKPDAIQINSRPIAPTSCPCYVEEQSSSDQSTNQSQDMESMEKRAINLRRSPQVNAFIEALVNQKNQMISNHPSTSSHTHPLKFNSSEDVGVIRKRKNNIKKIRRWFAFYHRETLRYDELSHSQKYHREELFCQQTGNEFNKSRLVTLIKAIKPEQLTPKKIDLLAKKLNNFCPIHILKLRSSQLTNESLDVFIELLPTSSLMHLDLNENDGLNPSKLQLISNLLEKNRIRFQQELNFFEGKSITITKDTSAFDKAKPIAETELNTHTISPLKVDAEAELARYKMLAERLELEAVEEERILQELANPMQISRKQIEPEEIRQQIKELTNSQEGIDLIGKTIGKSLSQKDPIYVCYFNAMMQDFSELMIATFPADNQNNQQVSMTRLPRLNAIFASFTGNVDFTEEIMREQFFEHIRNFFVTRSEAENLFTDTVYSCITISTINLKRDMTMENAESTAREDVRKIITAIISKSITNRSSMDLGLFITWPICMNWDA